MKRLAAALVLLLVSATGVIGGKAPPRDDSLWRVQFMRAADEGTDSSVENGSHETTIAGRILVTAADGGILLEDRTGCLWNITPERLVERTETDETFEPFDHQALAAELRSELGESFRFVRTEHSLIATSGSRVYAQWCGALLERLQRVFVRYWQAAGLEIDTPSSPLTVVVFGDRQNYSAAAEQAGGVSLIAAHGYYSMRTNRVMLVDMTSDRRVTVRTTGDVQRLAAANPGPVSTIVHEATHQIAFNCGLHTRYADNPVWLTEGMAMFWEVPDMRGGPGWRTAGRINRPRLRAFRQSLTGKRPADSLTSLLADDERFRDPKEIEAAYAEAWALTYFLMKTRKREYVSFLRQCSANTHLVWKTRNERLHDFEQAFSVSPATLDEEFLRFMKRMR